MQELHHLLQTTLQKKFGLPQFRQGQLEAITTLMTQGRALCILPTGYGKSLLYQLPACLLDGITIVISPLLALIRDQVDHLNRRFNISAMAINSDQSNEENEHVRQAAFEGRIKILFIAPEQFDHVDRFQFLLNLNVKLVVVDEAHCISTWGHDFRPSYRQILHFLHAVHAKNGDVKILGLTATANKHVEADIHKQLFFGGGTGYVLRQAMDRPNIQLSVVPAQGMAQKLAMCEQLLHRLEGCGLIYCATRENTELVAAYLQEHGLNVAAYHAGFENEEKKKLQKSFIHNQYKALAATNALGMGIDKGDLRYIIHFDFPGSITAYYQEVGRCGRDGQPAKGIMLYDRSDGTIQDYFIQSASPSIEDFQLVLDTVGESSLPLGLMSIKTHTGLHPTRVTTVIAELVEQGFLEKYSLNGKQVYRRLPKWQEPDLSRYKIQKKVKIQELKQMTNYGEQAEQCRMVILRRALGDEHAEKCLRCDCCVKDNAHHVFGLEKLSSIHVWMDKRPLIISPMVKEGVLEGLSVLDSKLRSPLFVRFMKQRACPPENTLGMDDELIVLLKYHLSTLMKKEKIQGMLMIPSKTWQARDRVAKCLADSIHVPLVERALYWKDIPQKRQGELLNNNQRRENVYGKMQATKYGIEATGALILFDDYIGSGNTIREAARALRACGLRNKLIPFTVATLKWHLGKPGFV